MRLCLVIKRALCCVTVLFVGGWLAEQLSLAKVACSGLLAEHPPLQTATSSQTTPDIVPAAPAPTDSIKTTSIEFFFRQSKTEIDLGYLTNAENAEKLLEAIKAAQADTASAIISVTYKASASPEGNSKWNIGLAKARLTAIRTWVRDNWIYKSGQTSADPLPSSLEIMTNNWREIYEWAQADSSLPFRETSLKLLRAASGIDDAKAAHATASASASTEASAEANSELTAYTFYNAVGVERVKAFRNGALYDYLYKNYFPSQRYGRAVVTISVKQPARTDKPARKPVEVIPAVAAMAPVVISQPEHAIARPTMPMVPEPEQAEAAPAPKKPLFAFLQQDSAATKRIIRVGTNLAYDAITVANISVEYGFCRNFSVGLRGTFSPWDITPTLKFRTLLFEPEFRWYPCGDFKRHHICIQGLFGWYNIAPWGSRIRYQDRDGSHPLFGAGINYGYTLPITKHLGFDFTVGVGYAYLDYDCFYNIPNGDLFNSEVRKWFGPTELGITFYYQF